MIIYQNSCFSLYFGSAHDKLMPEFYLNLPDMPLVDIAPFSRLKAELNAQHAVFLHQIHSDQGMTVDRRSLLTTRSFKHEGDYLVTDLKQVAIGVMAADCLPIVLCDTQRRVGAVVHAGWRGSVASIAVKALRCMQEAYGSQAKDIAVFFGPSARVCCYEVSRGFESHIEGFSAIDRQAVLIERGNKLFFNVPLFNQLQLQAAGIEKDAISSEYNLCTMCDRTFYSSRRDSSGRQMTVVALR